MKLKYLLLILLFVSTLEHQAQINSHIIIPQAVRIDTDLTANKSIYSVVNFNSPTYTIQNQTITNGSNTVANGLLAYDSAILKFNSNFVLQDYWHFGGLSTDVVDVVHEDENNNVYAVLLSNGSLTINNVIYNVSVSGQQTLIIKMNSTGQVVWVKKVDQTLGNPKIKTFNNEVFIAGQYNGMSLKIENTTVFQTFLFIYFIFHEVSYFFPQPTILTMLNIYLTWAACTHWRIDKPTTLHIRDRH